MDELFSSAEARQHRPAPSLLPKCERCGLYKGGCRTPKMPPDGGGRRKILLVSERPGRAEDEDGRPLVGKMGQMVESRLSRFGVDMRADCWLTNAIICYPTGEPPDDAVLHCRPNLFRTIERYKPEVIVLLGGDAIKSLMGQLWKEKVGEERRWVGWQIPSIQLNSWICPTYQPARLFYKDDPVIAGDFDAHLGAAAELSGRPYPDGPPDYNAAVETIVDPDAAAQRLANYTSGKIAFDFETDRLKPDHPDARIVCCSVCWNGQETIAYPWHGAAITATAALLANPDVGKIGWNLKFESRYVQAKLGIDVRGWAWDGMLAAHALDPRGDKDREFDGITGLKFQSFVRLGVPDYNYHIDPFLKSDGGGNAPNQIDRVNLPLVLKYCGLDSLFEYKIGHIQAAEMGIGL